jgi:hypothetical protein
MRIRVIAALLACASVGSLRATTLAPADLNELAVAASAIVYARITDAQAQASDDRLRVETLVTAEAIGYIKGNLGRTVAFRVPGGTIGAYKTIMVGAPSFTPGEEVILFIGTERTPHLVGFSQGVYRVRVDDRTGVRMVTPAPVFSAAENTTVKRGTRGPMPLDEFAQRVRQVVADGERR